MKDKFFIQRKYFKNEKFRSLILRNFRMLCCFLLPILILFSVLSFSLYSGAKKIELENLRSNNFSQSQNLLDIILETLDRDVLLIQEDPNVQTVINASNSHIDRQLDSQKWWGSSAQKRLLFICASNQMYDAIHIRSDLNDYVLSTMYCGKMEKFYDSQWLCAKSGTAVSVETRYDPFTNDRIISISRPFYKSNVIVGTITFNLDYDYIDNLFCKTPEVSTGIHSITGPDDTIVYSTEQSEIGKNISESIFSEHPEHNKQSKLLPFIPDDFHMSYAAKGGLTLYSIIDDSDYPHIRSALSQILVLGLGATLILALVLALTFSFRLYSYMLDIIESFQHTSPSNASDTESSIIRTGILNCVDRHEAIERSFAANLASLRKSQIMALQMQITPHFLLNTLQLINLSIMSQLHHDSDSTKLITLLSDILRNTISTKEYFTDFSSEIRMAKKYLEIESIRKQDLLEATWDIDPRVEQMSVVRCILQPLLENCIQHGRYTARNSPLKISISITLEETDVCVVIKDNGKGIPPQTLAEIKKQLSSSNLPENTHIGLNNVNVRIRLIFGVQDCLSIDSKEGEGTSVTLRFPAIPYFR